eukprot:3892481-Alexandrium_andersonii.AAC.1
MRPASPAITRTYRDAGQCSEQPTGPGNIKPAAGFATALALARSARPALRSALFPRAARPISIPPRPVLCSSVRPLPSSQTHPPLWNLGVQSPGGSTLTLLRHACCVLRWGCSSAAPSVVASAPVGRGNSRKQLRLETLQI